MALNGLLNGNGPLPLWVKAGIWLIERVGVPVVMFWLVWTVFVGDLRTIKEGTAKDASGAISHRAESTQAYREMTTLLRQICFRLSRDSGDQRDCFDGRQ